MSQNVYSAEYNVMVDVQMLFANFDQCRGYLDDVLKDPWFKRLYRQRVVMLKKLRSKTVDGVADSRTGTIFLGPRGYCDWMILHELAHLVTDAMVGGDCHGACFRRNYIKLASHFMGEDVGNELRAEFHHWGLKS